MRRHAAGAVVLAGALVLFAGSGAAIANEPDDIQPDTMALASAEGITDPVILDHIAELVATTGSEADAVTSWELTPEVSAPAADSAAAVATCNAATLIFFQKPTGTGSASVLGDSILSCDAFFTLGGMNDIMRSFNPDFGFYFDVAQNTTSGQTGSSMTNQTLFTCRNTNIANYLVESSGSVNIAGTTYTGAGNDSFPDLINCGT